MATTSQLSDMVEDLREFVGLSDEEARERIPDKTRFTIMLMTLEQTCHVLIQQFGTEGIKVVRAVQFGSGPLHRIDPKDVQPTPPWGAGDNDPGDKES